MQLTMENTQLNRLLLYFHGVMLAVLVKQKWPYQIFHKIAEKIYKRVRELDLNHQPTQL